MSDTFPLTPHAIMTLHQARTQPNLVLYGFRTFGDSVNYPLRIVDNCLYEIQTHPQRLVNTAHKAAARGGFVKTGASLYSEGLCLFTDKAHAERYLAHRYNYFLEKEKSILEVLQETKDLYNTIKLV